MARLRPRAAGGTEFCVGSWHGPVAFGPPAKVQMAVLVNVAAGALRPRASSAPDQRQIMSDQRQISARSSPAHRQITLPPRAPLTLLARTCAAQALLGFAQGTPCVLAGDFNQVAGAQI